MSFDKSKAMRSAERYVAQGKIRAAIVEYKAVVEHDARDITTLNMLGDLHAKSGDKREAVECYLRVAEHYSTQGFAQKAIAIYNKISRIQPNSIEVSQKLAELYKLKGSLSEARSHYETLAEHYETKGRRIEALSMWKQIALLDPNNTTVCLNLGESYLREGQKEEAAEAFAEAGARLARLGTHEEAIKAYQRSLDINSDDVRTLDGLVRSYAVVGGTEKAVSYLNEILENEPYNRDVLYLLIDCLIEAKDAPAAEKAVIRLVEIEPANYPRLVDLVELYLECGDVNSAARILTMSSEYMLVSGQGEECNKWISELLQRDPGHVPTLRLLVRYTSWIKEEEAFRIALERLAVAARTAEEAEDEIFALSQLTVLRPFETAYAERLAELVEEHGYKSEPVDAELLKAQFAPEAVEEEPVATDLGRVEAAFAAADERQPEIVDPLPEPAPAPAPASLNGHAKEATTELSVTDALKLQKEIDSISFYIENGYIDLAAKAINEVEEEFGNAPQVIRLKQMLVDGPIVPEPAINGSSIGLDEIRSEFGLTDAEAQDDGDFDTKYHTAIAYQEMGLTEDAIRLFQEACSLASPTDGTRRFFQCANLLGHCFMTTGHANMAVTWFARALETPELTDSERHGLWYELASAYDASGNANEAHHYYERVYTENVDFRDVASRVRGEAVLH